MIGVQFSYGLLWEFDPTTRPPDFGEDKKEEGRSVGVEAKSVGEEIFESVDSEMDVIPQLPIMIKLSAVAASKENDSSTIVDIEKDNRIEGPVQEQKPELFGMDNMEVDVHVFVADEHDINIAASKETEELKQAAKNIERAPEEVFSGVWDIREEEDTEPTPVYILTVPIKCLIQIPGFKLEANLFDIWFGRDLGSLFKKLVWDGDGVQLGNGNTIKNPLQSGHARSANAGTRREVTEPNSALDRYVLSILIRYNTNSKLLWLLYYEACVRYNYTSCHHTFWKWAWIIVNWTLGARCWLMALWIAITPKAWQCCTLNRSSEVVCHVTSSVVEIVCSGYCHYICSASAVTSLFFHRGGFARTCFYLLPHQKVLCTGNSGATMKVVSLCDFSTPLSIVGFELGRALSITMCWHVTAANLIRLVCTFLSKSGLYNGRGIDDGNLEILAGSYVDHQSVPQLILGPQNEEMAMTKIVVPSSYLIVYGHFQYALISITERLKFKAGTGVP